MAKSAKSESTSVAGDTKDPAATASSTIAEIHNAGHQTGLLREGRQTRQLHS